jgi:hypothetical protein
MTFAFPPARPGGAPVFNFRSEGRHFANSNRCLVPASAFFEFKEVPEGEAPIRSEGVADHGHRRTLEAGAWQPPADVHDADDGAGTGRRSVPQPASRGRPARGLVCLASLGQARSRTAAASSRRLARRCDSAGRKWLIAVYTWTEVAVRDRGRRRDNRRHRLTPSLQQNATSA